MIFSTPSVAVVLTDHAPAGVDPEPLKTLAESSRPLDEAERVELWTFKDIPSSCGLRTSNPGRRVSRAPVNFWTPLRLLVGAFEIIEWAALKGRRPATPLVSPIQVVPRDVLRTTSSARRGHRYCSNTPFCQVTTRASPDSAAPHEVVRVLLRAPLTARMRRASTEKEGGGAMVPAKVMDGNPPRPTRPKHATLSSGLPGREDALRARELRWDRHPG